MSRFALGLAALALLLVTGACDDDPEPKIADPTSEPPASEPTSKPPTTSAAPAPLTPEQAVRAWINGLSEAFASGDFMAVEDLTGPTCDTCQDFLDPVRETFANGGSYRTKPIRIVSMKAKPRAKRTVDVALEFPGGELIETSESTPTSFPSSKEILEFRVADQPDGSVVVTSVVFLS